MFSMIPRTGIFIASDINIETPFLVSESATACGVLTITAPVMGSDCMMER